MELLIATVTDVVMESDDVEEVKIIEDVKTIKKLETEIEEKSEQLQTLEAESDLFRGKLSENFCPLLELEFNLRIMEIGKKQENLRKQISELRSEKIKIREKLVSGSEDRTLKGIKNFESSFNFGVVSQPASDRNHETEFAQNQSERDDIPRHKDKVFLIKTELRQKLEHSTKAFWKDEDPVYKKHQKEKYFEFLSHLVECSSNDVRPHNLDAMVKVIYQTLELMTGGLNYQDAEKFLISDAGDVPDAIEIVRQISVGQAKALICDNAEKRDEEGLLQEEIEITAMVNSCLVETMKTCKLKKKRPNTKEAVDLLLKRETSEVMESMERLADRSDMENYNLARQKIQKLSQLYFVFMGPCDKRDLALTKTFFYDISVISLSVLGSILGLEVPFNPVLVGNSIDPSKTKFLKQTIFTVSRHLLCSIFRNKGNFDDFLMEMLILFMGEANDSTETRDKLGKKPKKETGDDDIIPPQDDSKGDEKFQSMRGKSRSRRGANSSHMGGAQVSRGRGPSPRRPGRCHQPGPRGQHQGHRQFV